MRLLTNRCWTLLASEDPWFQGPTTRGECTGFLHPGNGSKSVVYIEADLKQRHALLEDERVQAEVLDFLRKTPLTQRVWQVLGRLRFPQMHD